MPVSDHEFQTADANHEVKGERQDADINCIASAEHLDWKDWLQPSQDKAPSSDAHTDDPTKKKRLTTKRYAIKSEHYGRENLQDPDPTQKLEIDRVLSR